jgi:16S rRNA (cytidine1402-2'-O)-methyltransferase
VPAPEPTTLAAGLYIVATPIGNLGDLTPRAAAVLAGASLIAAEDTRVTARLLAHIGARVPMQAYHDYSDDRVRQTIITRALSAPVALVSDAGTPLISDPGFKLVREARAAGVTIVTLPGPCAAIAALTLSGLPTDRFLFAGFLPAKAGARATAIAELAGIRATLVLYESGPRLGASLAALAQGLGDRPAAVAREISKHFEECVTGSLGELAARYADAPPRGEIVITVAPPGEAPPVDAATLDSALAEALAGATVKSTVAAVAARLGLPRATVYARALALRRGE